MIGYFTLIVCSCNMKNVCVRNTLRIVWSTSLMCEDHFINNVIFKYMYILYSLLKGIFQKLTAKLYNLHNKRAFLKRPRLLIVHFLGVPLKLFKMKESTIFLSTRFCLRFHVFETSPFERAILLNLVFITFLLHGRPKWPIIKQTY